MEADNQTRTAADQLSRTLIKIRADVRSNLSQVGWHPCAPTERPHGATRTRSAMQFDGYRVRGPPTDGADIPAGSDPVAKSKDLQGI